MFTALWAQVLFAFGLIEKFNCLHSNKKKKKDPTRVLDIKGPVGVNAAVKHIGTNKSSVAKEAHKRVKTLGYCKRLRNLARKR